ncbi:hypothetical protein [Salimicrobium halophilum]|uniref:DUF4825 domain-containing protein n=1 Tax=Salimicrobium halophilum TaxID=86666 RepID=A0A1G8R947_9BACI|nr:hypothetical protein [Salimicrobium halophilum]SDJ13471.1 hypothetical protein SAMN04490247_0900 [Salimicrobium halophilum]
MMRISFLFLMLSGILIAGCQTNEEAMVSIDQLSISSEGLADGQNYYIISPFKWKGPEEAELVDISIVDEEGEPVNSSQGISASFYVAADTKQSGVYRRDDIGEKQRVDGYELTEEQTLIMQLKLNNVRENENRRLKVLFTSGDEVHEKLLEWEAVEGLKSSAS